jgi:capsular exopolysaccharide synthesis family protein
MEPLDYLKVLQRHWKVVVALVVVVLVGVYFVAPTGPATEYEATHRLLRDQASGDEGVSSADNPAVVELWVTQGEVPNRVKEVLGYSGSPDELVADLEVTSSLELGIVEITARAESPDEAITLANTFADETLKFIDEHTSNRQQEQAAQANERAEEIRGRINELDSQIAAQGGDDAPGAADLVRERDGLIEQLGTVEQSATATGTTSWISLNEATRAEKASTSAVAVTRGQALLLGVLVAVLLAFGVAIMLDRSDSRLHTKEQVERQFGLPVLAEVPLLPLRSRHRAAVFGYENDHRLAEAYRSLRTALLLFRDRLPLEIEAAELSGRLRPRGDGAPSTARQVIVVTSPEPGDGKSSTAANLAMAYAEAGQSVLLVQWDLWRPLSAKVFDAEDAPGVSEFLEAGNASLVNFVQSTSVPGLHLVPAGELGHQPGAKLDAQLRLLEEARSLADVVIIDTAPLLGASVTRELVTMADVVVLCARAGRTTSPAAGRTAELLERLGAPTLGVVLVGVPVGLFNDYYGSPKVRSRSSGGVERRRDRYAGPVDERDVFMDADPLPRRGDRL